MIDKDVVIELIREVFDGNVYPGDAFLQGSFEGCEPNEEVGFFMGKMDWKILDAGMLDSHYSALNFFSEAGFRFFIPAYLRADLQDGLRTADPLFHLTGGFYVLSAEISTQFGVSVRKTGGSVLLNPKRYGAMTYESLLAPGEELSTSRAINGFTVHFSAEAYDIEKNGDICFCIDAEGLPTKARWKPSYRFFKRKDGSVYY